METAQELCTEDSSNGIYIFSLRESLVLFRKAPDYELLRTYFPQEVIVQYAGDVDSTYSLLETVLTNTEDGEPAIEDAVAMELEIQLFDWNDQFSNELKPQLQAFGLDLSRDVLGGELIAGDRLVVTAPMQGSTL